MLLQDPHTAHSLVAPNETIKLGKKEFISRTYWEEMSLFSIWLLTLMRRASVN